MKFVAEYNQAKDRRDASAFAIAHLISSGGTPSEKMIEEFRNNDAAVIAMREAIMNQEQRNDQ